MTRSLSSLFAVTALLSSTFALGCGASPDASASGNAGAASTVATSSHREDAKACSAKASTALAAASTSADMAEAEVELNTCLVKANDASVGMIEAKLKTDASKLAGQAQSTFAGYRQAASSYCKVTGLASSSYGGTLAPGESATCVADQEQHLASLIDAWAPGTEPATPVAQDTEDFASCFAQYPLSGTGPDSSDPIYNQTEAWTCIRLGLEANAQTLATAILRNNANLTTDATTTPTYVHDQLDAYLADASQGLCDVLTDSEATNLAGAAASTVALNDGRCWVDAASLIGIDLLADLAANAAP